jgi:hypothetical protein
MRLPSRGPNSRTDREAAALLEERRARDVDLFQTFLRTHHPHALLLAATGEECVAFLKEIEQAVKLGTKSLLLWLLLTVSLLTLCLSLSLSLCKFTWFSIHAHVSCCL